MNCRNRLGVTLAVIALVLLGSLTGALRSVAMAAEAGRSLAEGDVVSLGGHKAVLTKLDTPPYVESDYSKRFRFDTFDNPKLKDLRERYRLDDVVAPGKDEFERQVLLLDWVN